MRVSTLNYPAALFVAAVAAQSLDKPPLQPDLNNLKDGFNANLHPVNGNQSPYQDGMIPQGCKDIVNDEHFDPADIQTVSVQYDDVGFPVPFPKWLILTIPVLVSLDPLLSQRQPLINRRLRQSFRHAASAHSTVRPTHGNAAGGRRTRV